MTDHQSPTLENLGSLADTFTFNFRGFILMLKHEDAAKVMNVHGKMLE